MAQIPMGKVIAYWVERGPNKSLITQEGTTVSRAEFDCRTNRLARYFRELGVKRNGIVTIALPNSIAFLECAFAAWKIGATPMPVSPKLPYTELEAILDLANPQIVVGIDPDEHRKWQCLPAEFQVDTDFSVDPLPEAIANYWKVITSGGSTGRPKLIVDHLPSVIDPETHYLGQCIDGVILNPGPLYHNAPFSVITHGMFRGNHIVNMARFDADEALQLIDEYKVQWVTMVPTMMSRIWKLPETRRIAFDLSSLEGVLHLASPCPQWLKQEWIDWLGAERIFELYGGTERQGRTWITGAEWLEHKGSVGRIQPDARIMVLNDSGQICQPGEIGEIFFLPETGVGSTYHYVGAEAKQASGGWESLGDIGWLDEDEYLYLADRRTDMIISGGANIYPAEIEAALDQHNEVVSSAAIGLPDDDLGQRVHAIIQVKRESFDQIDESNMREFLAQRLAKYKIPRSLEFVLETVRDDAGKVRRSKLREERMTG